MTSIRGAVRTVLLMLGAGLQWGCHAPLARPINCEQVLGLRIGQTTAQVRALLGEPAIVGPGEAVFFGGLEPSLRGVVWHYGPSPLRTAMTRDELDIAFYEDHLTWVTGYRSQAFPSGAFEAFWLMKDPRHPDQPEQRKKGEAFDELFPCRNQ